MWFTFEYPVSRAYPWRFTSVAIVLVSCIVFGALVYINLTIVGVTTYARYSSEFIQWRSPSWITRLDFAKMANYTIGCESATLVTGGMYQTPNGAFTYTIQSLFDASTNTPTSNANYNSSSLSSCEVKSISVSATYMTYEALFEAKIECSLEDNIELTATTTSVVRVPWIGSLEENSRVTPLAGNTSRLLAAFGSDYFEDVFFSGRTHLQELNKDISAMFYVYRMHINGTIDWVLGSLSAVGWLTRNPGPGGFRVYISPSSDQASENYLRVLSASILSDLGVTSQQNQLIGVQAFKNAIIPTDWSWRGNTTLISYSNAILGANMSDYNIPYDFVKPTYFNAQYLCHYIAWKSRISLVVDVFVATSSMFMVFWGALNLILAFFAKESSQSANYCACPNCDQSYIKDGDTMKLLHKSKSGKYNKVPSSPYE